MLSRHVIEPTSTQGVPYVEPPQRGLAASGAQPDQRGARGWSGTQYETSYTSLAGIPILAPDLRPADARAPFVRYDEGMEQPHQAQDPSRWHGSVRRATLPSVPRASLLGAVLAASPACEPRYVDVSDPVGSIGDTAEVPPGSSVLVVIANPVVNSPHDTGVPAEQGSARQGLDVDPMPGGSAATVDGLAVVDVPVGTIDLRIGPAALLLEVTAEGELIDAPIAFNGERASHFAGTPLRYPIGGMGVVRVGPDTPAMELSRTLKTDDAIVLLTPGAYVGDLMIKGNDVVIFGAGWGDLAVTIDGSVTIKSDGVRIRGVDITGGLDVTGDDVGIGFSRVLGNTNIGGRGGVFVHNVFCSTASVSTTAATWLDNYGIAPLESPPAGACSH